MCLPFFPALRAALAKTISRVLEARQRECFKLGALTTARRASDLGAAVADFHQFDQARVVLVFGLELLERVLSQGRYPLLAVEGYLKAPADGE
jgi:hypothetical protein